MYLVCSAKFCENLLVRLDSFSHFMCLIFCDAKLPQFKQNKKNNLRAQFSMFSMPLLLPFSQLRELLTPFALHKLVDHYDGCIFVFDG